MNNHTVTLTVEDGFLSGRMECHAPPDALCRARWDCDCEEWGDIATTHDGRPWHQRTEGGDRHYGRFDPDWCNHAEWFNDGDSPQ